MYIPDTCTDTLQYEIYLPEEEGLNIFYDLCVTDSFCAFLDTRNDTLLKIFTATIPPALVGLGMKGEGPDDFLFPFFVVMLCHIVYQNPFSSARQVVLFLLRSLSDSYSKRETPDNIRSG